MYSKKSNRLLHVDAIRGVTMLLVVYNHIVTFCLPSPCLTEINSILLLFRMPLFFFISGYFAYNADYTKDLLVKRSINRVVKQFYPTLILWLLCCFIFESAPIYDWPFDNWKNGYWFTFVPVEIFFIVAPLLCLFFYCRLSRKIQSISLTALCLIFVLLHHHYSLSGGWAKWNSLFCLWHLLCYIPFFILGMIVKLHNELFHKLFRKKWLLFLSTMCFICCIQYPNTPFYRPLSAISAIFTIYSLFFWLYNTGNRIVNKIFSSMAIIGCSTLEIYLIHYFIVYSVRENAYLECLDAVQNSIYEFPILLMLSIITCTLCLLAVRLLKYLNVYYLIFPAAYSRKAVKMVYNN